MITIPIGFKKDQQQTLIFIILVTLLTLVLYFYLLLLPQAMRLTDVFARAGKAMANLKSAQADVSKIDEFKNRIEEYKEKVDYYERTLPAEQEIPSLLEELSSMAKTSGIKLLSITPVPVSAKEQAAQKNKMYKEIPILITAKSGYHELGSFLNNLENADRFMKVVDLEVKSNKAAPKKHDVELLVSTYVSVGEK